MSGVLILGAGGHGKVVADILHLSGVQIWGFLDDNPQAARTGYLGLPILGKIADYEQFQPTGLVWGLGSNRIRQTLVQRLGEGARHLWVNAIHPRATIASSAAIGHGTVIAAHAVVNPDSTIGDHAIINTGATVDHDCRVEDYVHIAPGSHLAGGVTVEEGAFLGIGANVVPAVRIGQWATIGAGSVVLRDVPPGVTAYGVPARNNPAN